MFLVMCTLHELLLYNYLNTHSLKRCIRPHVFLLCVWIWMQAVWRSEALTQYVAKCSQSGRSQEIKPVKPTWLSRGVWCRTSKPRHFSWILLSGFSRGKGTASCVGCWERWMPVALFPFGGFTPRPARAMAELCSVDILEFRLCLAV